MWLTIFVQHDKMPTMMAGKKCILTLSLLASLMTKRQLLEMERLEANDLRSKGYVDRQLKELGFSDMVLHAPSVATMTSAGK